MHEKVCKNLGRMLDIARNNNTSSIKDKIKNKMQIK
jgi:hypothetical protein